MLNKYAFYLMVNRPSSVMVSIIFSSTGISVEVVRGDPGRSIHITQFFGISFESLPCLVHVFM